MKDHLLIDAGNTRIKWLLLSDTARLAGAVLTHDALDNQAAVAGISDAIGPREHVTVTVSNVAGRAIEERLRAAVGPHPVRIITPAAHCCGVTNHYNDPAQLGADRFAALIAAHHTKTVVSPEPGRLQRQSAKLVILAGTALTIDALAVDGAFMGGVIVPGLSLMRSALNVATAQLPPVDAGDKTTGGSFPRDTNSAIITGTIDAAIGAITQGISRLRHHTESDIEIIASGGAMALLQPALEQQLSVPLAIIDDLVLRGLHLIAVDAENRTGETGMPTQQSTQLT